MVAVKTSHTRVPVYGDLWNLKVWFAHVNNMKCYFCKDAIPYGKPYVFAHVRRMTAEGNIMHLVRSHPECKERNKDSVSW